jgi:hypothetical protein
MSHAGEQFGRRLIPPWELLRYYFSFHYWSDYLRSGGQLSDARSPLDLATALFFGALTVLSWRLRPRSLGLLATALYLPMISTGAFIAIERYGLELFPAFLVLGKLADKRWLVPLLIVSGALALLATGWVALGGGLA